MGLAASQARLLSLTARIHDVEYQAQMIQSRKLQLALNEDEVLRKYNEALDAETLTYKADNGTLMKANFDNLFGAGSIKNGLNTNYMLYDKNYKLIVPDDIYDAYAELAGGENSPMCLDPQYFAMYMMTGGNIQDIQNAENSLFDANGECNYKLSDSLNSIRQRRNDIMTQIGTLCNEPGSGMDILLACCNNGPSDGMDYSIASTSDIVTRIKQNYNPEGQNAGNLSETDYTKLCELLDSFESINEQFRYQLYNSLGETIFENIEGNNEKFDYDTYNYYLRYAMVIAEEGGLYGVSPANRDGGENFAQDAELLNEMLKSGALWLDVVSIDREGNLSNDITSTSVDSSVSFVSTSSVDSTALKKAEAEYNQAMKKIDRQDKQYDMELNRLETERSALTTEYDSVKKVIQENVERTFGIFS